MRESSDVAAAVEASRSRVNKATSRAASPLLCPAEAAALSVVLEHTADQLVRSRGGTLHFARCSSVLPARLLAR